VTPRALICCAVASATLLAAPVAEARTVRTIPSSAGGLSVARGVAFYVNRGTKEHYERVDLRTGERKVLYTTKPYNEIWSMDAGGDRAVVVEQNLSERVRVISIPAAGGAPEIVARGAPSAHCPYAWLADVTAAGTVVTDERRCDDPGPKLVFHRPDGRRTFSSRFVVHPDRVRDKNRSPALIRPRVAGGYFLMDDLGSVLLGKLDGSGRRLVKHDELRALDLNARGDALVAYRTRNGRYRIRVFPQGGASFTIDRAAGTRVYSHLCGRRLAIIESNVRIGVRLTVRDTLTGAERLVFRGPHEPGQRLLEADCDGNTFGYTTYVRPERHHGTPHTTFHVESLKP
jgi:hypothetical protein